MLDNTLRAHYLAAMDIVEWHLRSIKLSTALSYYQTTFADKDGTICLLADANLIDENIAAKEKKLLQAILYALGTKAEIILHENAPELSALKVTKLILMGDRVKQFSKSIEEQRSIVITTHSLNQLLLQPLLKAETWSELKKLEITP